MIRHALTAIIGLTLTGFAAATPTIEQARIDSMLKQVLAKQTNAHAHTPDAPKPDNEALRKNIIRELQTIDVLKAEALKAGLDKKPEVQSGLKNLESQFYAAQYIEHLRSQITINDADLRNTYDEFNRELKLQQVYFNTAAEAKEAQSLLLKGLTFEGLMKRFPNSEQSHQDWISPSQLPPELATILSMTRGEVTREPIKFNDRFYVFKVAAVQRSENAPPFEQVKLEQQEAAIQKKMQVQLEKLMQANGIE